MVEGTSPRSSMRFNTLYTSLRRHSLAQSVILVLPDISDVDQEFWSGDTNFGDDGLVNWDRVFGQGQITDSYLLALAVAHRGALATFDDRIALNAAISARQANLLL